MKTASQKAGKDARRSQQQQQFHPGQPKAAKPKGRRVVLAHFPHSKAGRPRVVEDIVGTPI